MALFTCRVSDKGGKIIDINKESSSKEALLREFQAQNLFPIRISEQTDRASKTSDQAKRFKPKAILDFTSTMGLLLSSGLSLKDSLHVSLTIFKKGHEHQIIAHILDKIDKGASFHNTLTSLGDNFPPLYRGLVRIGEKIGSLDAIFTRLAHYLADNKKIKDKVVGALIYPLIVLTIVLALAIVMTFVVFPAISNIFTQMGSKAVDQIQTRLLVYNLVMGIVFTVAVSLGILVAILNFLRRRGGALGEKIDRFLLSLPVGGRIVLYQESMNFLFAMETLTASGYSIEEALQEAALVIKNRALRATVASVRERVIRGESIAQAFAEQKLFPERISQWLLVGERSGQVEKVFTELSSYYQGEIDRWTTRFLALIDPVLMIMVGSMVLAFVLLFLLPIYTMYGNAMP